MSCFIITGCTADDDNVYDIVVGYSLVSITFGPAAVATISTSFDCHESSAFYKLFSNL